MFFKVYGTSAPAIEKTLSKQLNSFTKPRIQDWTADQPVDGLAWPWRAWSNITARYLLHNLHLLLK